MTAKMDGRMGRFDRYVNTLADNIGHADRKEPLISYIKGLCLPGDRKSIEPMAARIDPFHVQAKHQSMHHLISKAPWDDTSILKVARTYVLDQMERHGGVIASIVDDTGMKKKGNLSVGVARQYCGNLGKQENCQVSVSLSLANEAMSTPIAHRLYLPEQWANDLERRRKAGVPDDIIFQTKWMISLGQIANAYNDGVLIAPVLTDAGYGDITEFRDQLTEWKIPYVVGIKKATTFWIGKSQNPKNAESIARSLPQNKWERIVWREGTKGNLESRFAFVKVKPAHKDVKKKKDRPKEWLIIEWPINEKAPTKYWLSTLTNNFSHEDLVKYAKLRWRIERDYEELKSEFGLDHFEGRNWRGFHHHFTLCVVAYSFMISERAKFSPPETLSFLKAAQLPEGFRSRGSPISSRKAC